MAATGGVARAERDSSFVGGLPPAVLALLAILPTLLYPYDTEPRIVADFLHQLVCASDADMISKRVFRRHRWPATSDMLVWKRLSPGGSYHTPYNERHDVLHRAQMVAYVKD